MYYFDLRNNIPWETYHYYNYMMDKRDGTENILGMRAMVYTKRKKGQYNFNAGKLLIYGSNKLNVKLHARV